MNKYWVTFWQPFMIRFGPVSASSKSKASQVDVEDYGIQPAEINKRLASLDLPEKCWIEWAEEAPECILVFDDDENSGAENDEFFDGDGRPRLVAHTEWIVARESILTVEKALDNLMSTDRSDRDKIYTVTNILRNFLNLYAMREKRVG